MNKKKINNNLLRAGLMSAIVIGALSMQTTVTVQATITTNVNELIAIEEGVSPVEEDFVNIDAEILGEDTGIATFGLSTLGNQIGYINADQYRTTMQTVAEPYLDSIRTEGYFTGKANIQIHYEKYINKNATDSIVLFHGMSETTEKFHELIYYFSNNGYNVYIAEHRGHGNSDRFVSDVSKVYVDNYKYYVDDQKTFVDTIVKPDVQAQFGNNENKVFLYSHSMGGAIASVYTQTYKNDFDAVVISAPLFQLNTGLIPECLMKTTVNSLTLIGKGNDYAPTGTTFSPEIDMATSYSSCFERVEYYRDLRVADASQQLFGPTNKWVVEAFKLMDCATAKKGIQGITTPVLLVTGMDDTAVVNSSHDKVASYNKNYITHVKIYGGRHELYMERDELQKVYLDRVFDFYDSYR